MNTQKDATPRPWTRFEGSKKIFSQMEMELANCNTEKTAEFIVTAVNAHDKLVEALRMIDGHTIGECSCEDVEKCNEAIRKITVNTLALAEGKTK